MAKASISVTVDEATLALIDSMIKNGIVSSRSEAVRTGLGAFMRDSTGVKSRKELREQIRKRLRGKLKSAGEAIRAVREEGEETPGQ